MVLGCKGRWWLFVCSTCRFGYLCLLKKRIKILVFMIGICHFNCLAPSDPWDRSIYLHPSSLVSAHAGKLPILIRFHVAWIFLNIAQLRNKKTCFTCWTRHGSLWIKYDIEIKRTVFLFAGKNSIKCFPPGFLPPIFLELHCCNHPPWEASVKRWLHSPSEKGQNLVFMPVGSIFAAKSFSCFAAPKNSDYHHLFGVG